MKYNCFCFILIITFLNLSSCTSIKTSKYSSCHPIICKTRGFTIEEQNEAARRIREIYPNVGGYITVCGDVDTFEMVESLKPTDSMPKVLRESASSNFQDVSLQVAIASLNKTSKLKIKQTNEILNNRNLNINLGEMPLYMIFHRIALNLSIGWGIKGNVVYFGRNLNNMDYIGAQYSDLYKESKESIALTKTLQ